MRRFMIVLALTALGMLALAPSVLAKGTATNNFVAQLSGAWAALRQRAHTNEHCGRDTRTDELNHISGRSSYGDLVSRPGVHRSRLLAPGPAVGIAL